MGVIALEAVVEKGVIRLDSFRDLPERTKVFVLIPSIESSTPQIPAVDEPEIADVEQESVLELFKRLKQMALTPSKTKINVTDFAGLGADMWSSIDVDAYIDEERNSWERSLTE